MQFVKLKSVELSKPKTSKGRKSIVCENRISAAFIEELLKCEFQKGRLKQNIHFFHIYLYYLIDLAMYDMVVDADLERIILSTSDMNVISDYYYLAATLLRILVSENCRKC